jgi:hypothetical protein
MYADDELAQLQKLSNDYEPEPTVSARECLFRDVAMSRESQAWTTG